MDFMVGLQNYLESSGEEVCSHSHIDFWTAVQEETKDDDAADDIFDAPTTKNDEIGVEPASPPKLQR